MNQKTNFGIGKSEKWYHVLISFAKETNLIP